MESSTLQSFACGPSRGANRVDSLTPVEIADFEIPVGDRTRALTRCGILPDRLRRLFACWCARRTFARIEDLDPRLLHVVDVAERFAIGKATDEEFCAADGTAEDLYAAAGSMDLPSFAALCAAKADAEEAAREAADAAWTAGWAATHTDGVRCIWTLTAKAKYAAKEEEEKQLAKLLEMILAEDKL